MTDIRAGDRIGKFEIQRELGAGGMGKVFEARDTLLGRHVALKFLRAGGADPDLLLRGVVREGRILAELNHPNIVHLYDAAMFGDTPYFVMELVRGHSLRTICTAFTTLETFDALSISVQIGEGLCTAHGAGIIHNDLKPENVMLTAKPMGQVKLVDFGLSRTVERASTGTTGELVDGRGTPHYMAPEVHCGDRATEKSDVYTWGQMTHEMLTGRFVFSKTTDDLPSRREVCRLHCEARPISIVDIRGESLAEVERIVFAMLAKSPGERPTALEAHRLLVTELGRLEAELPQLSDRTLTADMARPAVQVPVQLTTGEHGVATSKRTLPAGTLQPEAPPVSAPVQPASRSRSGASELSAPTPPPVSRSGPVSLAGASRVGGRMQTFLTAPLGSATKTAVVGSEAITLHDGRDEAAAACVRPASRGEVRSAFVRPSFSDDGRGRERAAPSSLRSVDVSFASTEPLAREAASSDSGRITGPTPPPVTRSPAKAVRDGAGHRKHRRIGVLIGFVSACATFVVLLARTDWLRTSAQPAASAGTTISATTEPPVASSAVFGPEMKGEDAGAAPSSTGDANAPAVAASVGAASGVAAPAVAASPVASPQVMATTDARAQKPAPRPSKGAPPGQRVCDLSWRGCLLAGDVVCVDMPQHPACNHGPQSSLPRSTLDGLIQAKRQHDGAGPSPSVPPARTAAPAATNPRLPSNPRKKLPSNPDPKKKLPSNPDPKPPLPEPPRF